MRNRIYVGLIGVMALTVFMVQAQQPSKKENVNGRGSMSQDEMNKRGDHVMGFDHTKTTHDEIRSHLGHISKMFAEGNFNAPMLIHEQTPPGVPVMQKLKNEIEYRFEETEHGATIHISTTNSKALQAIYKFLRFQIKEHQTGDSLEVRRESIQ